MNRTDLRTSLLALCAIALTAAACNADEALDPEAGPGALAPIADQPRGGDHTLEVRHAALCDAPGLSIASALDTAPHDVIGVVRLGPEAAISEGTRVRGSLLRQEPAVGQPAAFALRTAQGTPIDLALTPASATGALVARAEPALAPGTPAPGDAFALVEIAQCGGAPLSLGASSPHGAPLIWRDGAWRAIDDELALRAGRALLAVPTGT